MTAAAEAVALIVNNSSLRATIVREGDVPAVLSRLADDTTLSGGEKVLVECALTVWNGGGSALLQDVVRNLDDPNLGRVLEAIRLVRPGAHG